ncbi:MAG: SPOR domain-containing protein [Hyphomonadaceae bacterium]|nr:SPOR domain-containing protein [Hyphomonadaceae bacterium]
MRAVLVSYLRFVGISVVALAAAACAKLAPAELGPSRPEPLIGEAPKFTEQSAPRTSAERIEALEYQVEALNGELTNLRKALEVMGPLPEQADLFIATAMNDAPETDPAIENSVRLARLYAPAPKLNSASSLFYEAELGSFRNQAAAEAGWKRLALAKKLAGLSPRYGTEGQDTRLIAGPLASEAAVNSLCVELSALDGACRVAAPVRAY